MNYYYLYNRHFQYEIYCINVVPSGAKLDDEKYFPYTKG